MSSYSIGGRGAKAGKVGLFSDLGRVRFWKCWRERDVAGERLNRFRNTNILVGFQAYPRRMYLSYLTPESLAPSEWRMLVSVWAI